MAAKVSALDISANGMSLLHKAFASGAAAVTCFTNHAVDLGALSASLFGGAFDLHVALDVTSTGSGSGFHGNLLIGDPPPAVATARPLPEDHFVFGHPAGAAPDATDHVDWRHSGASHAPVPYFDEDAFVPDQFLWYPDQALMA